MPTFATFNANNFFLRYKFQSTFPGDTSRKSQIEATEVATIGYLPEKPFKKLGAGNFFVWDEKRRVLADRALREPDGELPDILCLQEVENLDAIRLLNENYFGNFYPYRLLIDGYDPRNIDVGMLSRFPIVEIRTHLDQLGADGLRVFSRDCLEVTVLLESGEPLTLLVNHFKSKLVMHKDEDTDEERVNSIRLSHGRRLAQAEAVARHVDERFAGRHDSALYAVVGDFNDVAASPYIAPIVGSPHLTDVLEAHLPGDNWTYYWRGRNRVSRIDFVLASRTLAGRIATQANMGRPPHIERRGLGYRELGEGGKTLPRQVTWTHFEEDEVTSRPIGIKDDIKVDFRFERYPKVVADPTANISDHCPVKVWF